MDELDRCSKLHMIVACVAQHTRGRERQKRPQPLATRLDQMRRDFGNAGSVLACHALTDQAVHCRHVSGQCGAQPVLRCADLFHRAFAHSVHAALAALAPRERRE